MLPTLSHPERMQRAQDKREALLAFLASGEVYTTAVIAARVLGLSERRAVTCMQALERDGCIKSELHEVRGRQLRIYGVTPHGCAVAGAYGAPFFELGRTNSSWVSHRVDTQRMRLAAEAAGVAVAIEIERHCKTPKRYAEIIVSYLQEVKSGRYGRIDFVSPPGISRLVQGAFMRVEFVKFQGETVRLTPAHRARFTFSDFNTWPAKPAEREQQ